ncbi:MAG: flagellar basal body rod protein FlgB [Burkholderiaceae bacterium]
MLNRLNDALDFHGQALGLRSQRQRLIASNIANADTPGFVARDFDFAQALRAATAATPNLQSTLPGAQQSLARSSAGHIVPGSASSSAPALDYAMPSQTNLDRNTVDMDRERAAFVDNAVKYEATLRFINGHVRTMLEAIKGQ